VSFLKLFILLLALLLLAGFYLIRRIGLASRRQTSSGRIKLVITVKDQEPWVEGFVRKLYSLVKNNSRLDVVIVDNSSCDRTPDILKRLAGVYPFRFLNTCESGSCGTTGSSSQEGELNGAMHFDVRGLSGKDLLDAPLFYRLSHLNEGKS